MAIATSGPGATNLTTGIANAMLDSVPTVFITGQVAAQFLGSDAFQETDVTGITLPITKHALVEFQVEKEHAVLPMVPAGADLGEMIRRPVRAAAVPA